ncbi:hypothetical protein [Bradyrhizobium genosp. L]|nr:hypothetical protein [Bradyrhizobium genosp. L]
MTESEFLRASELRGMERLGAVLLGVLIGAAAMAVGGTIFLLV